MVSSLNMDTSFLKGVMELLRLAAATALFVCGIEALVFSGFDIPFQFLDLGLAVSVGFAASVIYSFAAAAVFHFLGADKAAAAKFTSLAAGLALLYLVVIIWIEGAIATTTSKWAYLAIFLAVLALTAALARVFWLHLGRGDPDLAFARFQAVAPVSALCAGLYSAALNINEKKLFIITSLGVLALLVFGHYLLVRFLWRRRKARFAPRARRIHYALITGVILAASTGAALDHRAAAAPATAPEGSPPVILITVDTLRSDHLSSYHKDAPPTPAMDSLARDGIRFEQVMAPSSWTPPSVASFLTGLYPSACGAGILIPGKTPLRTRPYDYTGPLEAADTLAEIFAQQGYVTAAFVNRFWLSANRGFAQGFRVFRQTERREQSRTFLFSKAWAMAARPFIKNYRRGAELTNLSLNWLRNRPSGPFFMWIHYLDPHMPYLAHERYPAQTKPGPMDEYLANSSVLHIRSDLFGVGDADKQFLRERYQGEVRYVDDQVGTILRELKKQELYKKSVIAFSSDHGEEFWEHGNFEHGHAFFDEVIHVPLIIKLPEGESAGKTVSAWVSLVRLGVTLLDAAGVNRVFPGASLLGCLRHPSCPDPGNPDGLWLSERTLYGEELGAVGDRDGRKALLHGDGSVTCFDLAEDPGEKRPLYGDSCPWQDKGGPSSVFRTLKQSSQKTFMSLGGMASIPEGASRGELRELRSLGYMR